MKDTLERVSEGRTWLTAKIPFLGFLSLQLRPREATEQDGVPTAGVGPDGTLVINPTFLEGLDDPEVRGLLAHEVLHPALHVFERQGNRSMMSWNIAHDYVINLIITEFIKAELAGHIRLPKGGLLDPKYASMSAEEVWESFSKQKQKQPKDGDEGGIGGDCRRDLSSTPDGKAAAQGGGSARERLARDWKVAVVAAAAVHERQKGRGSLPGGLKILIDELLEPKQHWMTLLNQWIGQNAGQPDLTYMRPSRRSAAVGEILIGRRRDSYPDVTVMWDTSGSQSGTEKYIFPEVMSICEELDLTIRVIIIDSAIHADLEDVDEAQDILDNLSGGGGSNFCPAFDRLDEERNNSVVIAFTDGYIGVPETMPESLQGVVWVLTQGGSDPTGGKWGQVLRLDPEENGKWE